MKTSDTTTYRIFTTKSEAGDGIDSLNKILLGNFDGFNTGYEIEQQDN